jgi:hypothetical protein
METMWVRMRVNRQTNPPQYAGQVYELPFHEGNRLIGAGNAEPYTPPPPEEEAAETVEAEAPPAPVEVAESPVPPAEPLPEPQPESVATPAEPEPPPRGKRRRGQEDAP